MLILQDFPNQYYLKYFRYVNTKEFSEEEKKDRKIDVLSGFELMDSECRIYIIEGLGGEGRAMH